MAGFLAEEELNYALASLFKEAKSLIVIISPFIRLHRRIKDILLEKSVNEKIECVVLFGKNENDLSRSLDIVDLEFFKEFEISIHYNPELHAKYYANESYSILTSMNLLDYSQNNNIEFGIEYSSGSSLDKKAWAYFSRVIDNSELLFQKGTKTPKKIFGTKTEPVITITVNNLERYFSLPSSIYSKTKPKKHSSTDSKVGYCIRTGQQIPFNPDRPMSYDAYKVWAEFENPDYKEQFCHKTGKPSNGRTSMRKPIL